MADLIEGMDDLQREMDKLPEKLQRRIARLWAKRWSQVAWSNAIKEAPIGPRRNLVAGIARRDSRVGTLRKLRSMARSVVIGKKPAYHFHWVVMGISTPRKTKKGANRGIMPANPFMERAMAPLVSQAEQDLRTLVRNNLQRLLKKGG